MRRSLLWIVALSLPFLFLGLLAYLLKDSVLPVNWSELKASDLINLGALAIGFLGAFVAIGSLFVAVSQLRQAVKDNEEQQKSLDASRAQLKAVVETVKKPTGNPYQEPRNVQGLVRSSEGTAGNPYQEPGSV